METVTGFATPEEAALDLELPLLGTLRASENVDGPVAAAFPADETSRREYNRAVDRILLSPLARLGSIGLIGDVDGSRRADVAARLSASIASERTAILVDADLRGAHLSFDDHGRAQEGLVDVLRYGVRSPRVISPTQAAGLNLLPVGSGTVDFAGTFRSGAVPALFEELRRTGDLIIVNGPDLSDFQAAAPFLSKVSVWILVHHIGASDAQKTRTLRDTFGREKCLGVIALTSEDAVPRASSSAVRITPEPVATETDSPPPTHAIDEPRFIDEPAIDERAIDEPAADEPLELDLSPAPLVDPERVDPEPEPEPELVMETEAEAEAEAVELEPEPVAETPRLPDPDSVSTAEIKLTRDESLEIDEDSDEFVEIDPPAAELPRDMAPADSYPEELVAAAETLGFGADTDTDTDEDRAREAEAAVDRIFASDAGAEESSARRKVPAPPKEAHPKPRSSDDPPVEEPPLDDDDFGGGDDGGGEWRSRDERRGVSPVIWIVGVALIAIVAVFFLLGRGGEEPGTGSVAQVAPGAGAPTGTATPGPASTPDRTPAAPLGDTGSMPADGPGATTEPAGTPAGEAAMPTTSAGSATIPTGTTTTGTPPTGTPATGTPATGTPATGTPATGTPATGTPATTPATQAAPPTQTPAPTPTQTATPVPKTGTPAGSSTPKVDRSAPVGTTAELFYVHVSSLKTRASALQEAERLRATDQPVVMRSVDLGDKGTWWRVYLGPYGVRADAQAAAAAAKAAGLTDYTQIHRLSSSQVEAGKG